MKIVVVKSPKFLTGFLKFLFKIKDEEKQS
ncbi:MAG: stage V sporulation protein SpoVM [Oscillospiraceae bacterium]|nr:stage V sporulation protein SpoVM [Oscillospiraceae bacterium]